MEVEISIFTMAGMEILIGKGVRMEIEMRRNEGIACGIDM